MFAPAYLDHNATTPLDARVLEAMLPFLRDYFANPSAGYSGGRTARSAVQRAREQVATLIGADAGEIVFTSGGTESINAVHASVRSLWPDKPDLVITGTEHPAVLESAKRWKEQGGNVLRAPVHPNGRVDLDALRQLVQPGRTALFSIMWANNEIGTINEISQIGELCKSRDIIFHSDATQWVGKMPTDVYADNIDLMSFSGHKLYGPKGVGALFVRRKRPRVRLTPLVDGGGQERGFRSGTLNVTGIVGLGKACEIAGQEMSADAIRLGKLRKRLEDSVTSRLDTCQVNGHREKRLPHITNISFGFVEGESLMMAVKEIACSSGSACTSASLEPSYVLKNIGVGDDLAHSSLRLSLGRWTTDQEIDYSIEKIVTAVKKLRDLSPLYDMHKEGIDLSKVEWAHH